MAYLENAVKSLFCCSDTKGGFSITIILTNFNSPNPSNYPHFTFLPILDGLSKTEATTTDIVALFFRINTNCVVPFQDCMSKLLSEDALNNDEPVPACFLITDVIWHFTQSVADALKVPILVLWTTSAVSFLEFVAFPVLLGKGYLPIQESQLEALVSKLPHLKMPNMVIFDKMVDTVVKETKVSSGIIINSFEDVEEPELFRLQQEFNIPIFPIGSFHKYFPVSSSSLLTQDQSSISWLDTQPPKSVIYVSFGSIAAIDATQFLEIGWGLANTNRPFLWVVQPELVHGSEWLEQLPSGFLEMLNNGRGHIVKWAPQPEVLAHPAVGGFWTHNGWNSTLESVCEGVPMICLPCFGDQMVNASYITDVWKIGLRLEKGLVREEIENEFGRLMVGEEGKMMRERVMNLKDKTSLCLKPGGSSYISLDRLISFISSFK